MAPRKRERRIGIIFHDTPGEWEVVIGPDAVSTDAALVSIYTTMTEVHADAWMLNRDDQLPEWWRLVDCIRAEGLATGIDLITWPEVDAALRFGGLTIGEQTYDAPSWRKVLGGPDAGKVVPVTEQHRTGILHSTDPDRSIRHPDVFTSPEAFALVLNGPTT